MVNNEIKVHEHLKRTKSIFADGSVKELQIEYMVQFAKTPEEALEKVRTTAHRKRDNFTLSSLSFSDYENGIYTINADYSILENAGGFADDDADDIEPVESFDCSTGTQRITEAISQGEFTNSPWKKFVGDRIGWNGNEEEPEFSGVDILTGTIKLTFTQSMMAERLDRNFKRNIFKLTGTVNKYKWKDYETGELLFLGASFSGNMEKRTIITVTYNFALQFNEMNAEVGTKIRNKKGWWYIWTTFGKMNVNTKKSERKGVWMAQIYEEEDFSTLGIN